MATQTVTKTPCKLVLRLSIPVTDRSDEEAASGGQRVTSGREQPELSRVQASVNRLGNNDLDVLETSSGTSESSDSSQLSFEGDRINPARFRWMPPIPQGARRRLLLAVEPFDMAPWTLFRGFLDDAEGMEEWEANAKFVPADDGIAEDFCIRFSRHLIAKLRDSMPQLLHLARRNYSWLYMKRTLLLRGSRRTNTWTKYLMCRVCCTKPPLLSRFFSMLGQFDSTFSWRCPVKPRQPRVTLVPNRTVPENTPLCIARQRLRHVDNYFGKMPLVPNEYLSNLVTKLTINCIQETSTLAQLVEFV